MTRTTAYATAVLLAGFAAGCSFLTDVEQLEEFEYGELESGHNIEESADAAAFAGEILFVGQFKTPHACYDLRPRFEESGRLLTLRISAVSRNEQCPTQLGAYRYTGAVRRIKAGDYDFRLIHVVPGQADAVYTFPVSVR